MTFEERYNDIKNHPEKHKHTYFELIRCCEDDEMAIHMILVEAHQKYVDLGTNGGVKCDVTEGACACEAWHNKKIEGLCLQIILTT